MYPVHDEELHGIDAIALRQPGLPVVYLSVTESEAVLISPTLVRFRIPKNFNREELLDVGIRFDDGICGGPNAIYCFGKAGALFVEDSPEE